MIDAIEGALGSCGIPARVRGEYHSPVADAYGIETRLPKYTVDVYGKRALGALESALGSGSVRVSKHGGKPLVIIPRAAPGDVTMRGLWKRCPPRKMTAPLGSGWDGRPVRLVFDPEKGCNVLAGGMNGCGKSVALIAILAGLAAGTPPDALEIIAVDAKGSPDKTPFHGPLARLPHLRYAPILTHEPDDLAAVSDMLLAELNRRRTEGHSRPLAVFIDEAHLMPQGDLSKLLREGRGFGVFWILATQFQREADSLGRGVWSQIHTRILGKCAIGDWYTSVGLIGDARAAESLPGDGVVYTRKGNDLILTRVGFSRPGDGFWTAPGWAARGATEERQAFRGVGREPQARINAGSRKSTGFPAGFLEWIMENAGEDEDGNPTMPGEHACAKWLAEHGHGKNYTKIRAARSIVAKELAASGAPPASPAPPDYPDAEM